MPLKTVSSNTNVLANGQNSEKKSENVKRTDNHQDEYYGSHREQFNIRRGSEGKEEMNFTTILLEGDKTQCSEVQHYDVFHPCSQIISSHHDSTEESDARTVKMGSVPLDIIAEVSVYQCKYCSEEYKDTVSLIVPCRCSGSLEYVHQECLKNWIEINYEGTSDTVPRCEICRYSFGRQKRYKLIHCFCQELSLYDRWRYSVGSLCVFIVLCCILILILCFTKDNPVAKYYAPYKADMHDTVSVNAIDKAEETYRLSTIDNVKIVCGVLFIIFTVFCVFIGKSCNIPPHKLILACIQSSKQWTILPYSASNDSLLTGNETNT